MKSFPHVFSVNQKSCCKITGIATLRPYDYGFKLSMFRELCHVCLILRFRDFAFHRLLEIVFSYLLTQGGCISSD